MYEAPYTVPFRQALRAADIHAFEVVPGRLREARQCIELDQIFDGSLDSRYRRNVIPSNAVNLFEQFVEVQRIMWQVRPGQHHPPLVDINHINHTFDSAEKTITNQAFALDKHPFMDVAPDVIADAREINVLIPMLLGRVATAQAVIWRAGGLREEAEDIMARGLQSHADADLLMEGVGSMRPVRIMNALYAARLARIRDDVTRHEAWTWLRHADDVHGSPGVMETWVPSSITAQDITESHEVFLRSVYERP